ncbi:MAG: hypothetical protein ACYTFT_03810 [Planctomycetota bacterium]|jgi:hypothetical protein
MSGGVGSVGGGTPIPDPVVTDPADTTTTVDSTTTTDTVSRTATSTRPAPPEEPKASDIVPAEILEKYGLTTDAMATESLYEGADWSVGYYPYSGDIQYEAFGKHGQLFGAEANSDAHGYWEFFSSPPTGLQPGSRIFSGTIRESDFESATGTDVTGSRIINNAAYKALVEAGAAKYADFSLRDKNGEPLEFNEGDTLVATKIVDGQPVESSEGNVYRIKRANGEIRYDSSDMVEERDKLTGAEDGVKFDFLDATGGIVSFDASRDRIVPGFADGDAWHVLVKGEDTPPTYEHQVIENGSVTSTEQLSEADAEALMDGKEMIHRVQNQSSGALSGDGKVSGSYDMSWWGKCHNTASIGTSNMKRPEQPVRVITNLEPGDAVGVSWEGNLLKPNHDPDGAITGYTHEVTDASGAVTSADVTVEAGNQLAADNEGQPVILRADGTQAEARMTEISTRETDALVSHIGDGGVIPKGGDGSRYYAHEDILVMANGDQVQAHIKDVKLANGETIGIGSRSGFDYNELDRQALRSPGMDSRILGNGTGRSYAFNVNDMKTLNEHRGAEEAITELTVIHPDGREETIDAADVGLFAWENKFDFRPDELWNLHKTVNAEGSTVIEQDPGTHVWNYTIKSVDTQPIKPEDLSADMQAKAALPGMMSGTVGDEDKYFFETKVNSNTYKYWVRFDDQGEIKDFAYLNGKVPDFTWTQHIKDAYTETWTGGSQAPGADNGDIQRIYLASIGAFGSRAVGGMFLTEADLKNAPAVKPEE